MIHILIVDDNKSMCKFLEGVLKRSDYCVFTRNLPRKALELFSGKSIDIMITDVKMPQMSGLELLQKVREISPTTAVIAISGHSDIADAVRAMKLGALDFIEKPFSSDEIKRKIERIVIQLCQGHLPWKASDCLIGESTAMRDLQHMIDKVAISASSVIIVGESGTGKELVARAIHQRSLRRDNPFIAVNCGALVANLLEDELFGHERGAYTGAHSLKKGRFELADGGTMLLDEIAEMPFNLQVKLLRVLQESCFERVGGTRNVHSDIRIIAATNKKLSRLVEDGEFREDLYYRLNVITIEIPPLRDRREDIRAISKHYLVQYASEASKKIEFASETLSYLQAFAWPGNVRQLQNAIRRGVILLEGESFTPDYLPPEIYNQDIAYNADQNIALQMDLIEKETIRQALKDNSGNQSRAARELGIKRTALRYKMKKYNLT